MYGEWWQLHWRLLIMTKVMIIINFVDCFSFQNNISFIDSVVCTCFSCLKFVYISFYVECMGLWWNMMIRWWFNDDDEKWFKNISILFINGVIIFLSFIKLYVCVCMYICLRTGFLFCWNFYFVSSSFILPSISFHRNFFFVVPIITMKRWF